MNPEERPEGEQLLLDGLADGTFTLGDFMNVCAVVTERFFAEARAFKQRDITRAAKAMRKAWKRFQAAWNGTLIMAREFASAEGLGPEEVELYDPDGPEDKCS